MFYIAAIFVKYCYTTGSWLFWLMSQYMLFRLLTTRGEIIVKPAYWITLSVHTHQQLTRDSFHKRSDSHVKMIFVIIFIPLNWAHYHEIFIGRAVAVDGWAAFANSACWVVWEVTFWIAGIFVYVTLFENLCYVPKYTAKPLISTWTINQFRCVNSQKYWDH